MVRCCLAGEAGGRGLLGRRLPWGRSGRIAVHGSAASEPSASTASTAAETIVVTDGTLVSPTASERVVDVAPSDEPSTTWISKWW